MTLLELMTAITILGILTAIAVPSFRTYTINSRINAAANDLVTALNLARSEALRRSGPVVICASADQATCSEAEDWTTGWIVFVPDAAGGVSQLLQVWPTLTGLVVVAADQDRVTYNTMGMVTSAASLVVASQGCAVERRINVAVSLSGGISSKRNDGCPP